MTFKKVHRRLARWLGRRSYKVKLPVPYVSFSFDDFPRSAALNGARVLEKYGRKGTYFVSMGLLGKESPSGRIAELKDVSTLLRSGHEIGSHTFDHCDGTVTDLMDFEASVIKNDSAFTAVFPTERFLTFAYPLDGPTFRIKKAIGKRFLCCRGGGQATNSGSIDLNLLKAFFLDWRCRNHPTCMRKIIDRNRIVKGWLIFATHDVGQMPSKYGCTEDLLEETVRYALESGAKILPIKDVCKEIGLDLSTWG